MKTVSLFALIVSVLTAPAAAEMVCGTSPETQRRVEELHRRTRSRVAVDATGAQPPTTRFADEVLFVRADELTAPNDDPADLEGISLQITRRDAATFAVTRGALQYDEEIGLLYATFGRGTVTKELALPFAFPFGATSYPGATLSIARGVHFTKALVPSKNVEAMTLALASDPMLSPLFDYIGSPGGAPNVYVKAGSDRVTITWRRADEHPMTYDVQAVLYASGDVRFSYRTVRRIGWGGVVVRTGNSAWMQRRSPVATLGDVRGEVDPLYAAERDMLDITGVELSRVDATSLLEVRIHLAGPVDRNVLREGASYLVFLGDSLHRFELFVYRERLIYRDTVDSPAARIEGSDVVLLVPDEGLPRSGKIWVYTNAFTAADSVEATVDLGGVPAEPLEIDFSALTSIETSRPLVEAYRLPTVNVAGVWERLQNDFGYRDDEIDAVAIYSDFPSDILLSPYGAFATLANPGADGISQFSSSANPRTPTLMHMNSLFAFEGEAAAQLLLHELGHRWLYYFEIDEAGGRSRAHNPKGYHPAQWVHTPGAFGDASPMGGTAFHDNGDGSFSTPSGLKHMGYSWHELYLMGLARTEEVQPWYYLTGTALGDEYFPPPGQTVSGKRVDVNVQQIVSAMGPRHPSFDASRKEFRVLFVVIERTPAAPVPPFRTRLEEAFLEATGERGRVVTALSLAVPVAAFKAAAAGTSVQFTDESAERPLAWEWSFGDGGSSRARNPRHVYERAGTFEVTLKVTNTRGTSTTKRLVTVSGGGRKRRAV